MEEFLERFSFHVHLHLWKGMMRVDSEDVACPIQLMLLLE